MVLFSEFVYNAFPYRFRVEDTYIDQVGKGLFQRYIETLGDEWDEELVPKLEAFTTLSDVLTVDSLYIAHLAWFLGNPPDMLYTEARYRKLLRYFIDLVKFKGTVRAYEMIFFLLGLGVTLEFIPLEPLTYDLANKKYDETLRYDSECPSCSDYYLHILDPNGNQSALGAALEEPSTENAALLALLNAIIKFVEPINLRLLGITYEGGSPADITNWVLTTGIWDDTLRWADQKIYKDTP